MAREPHLEGERVLLRLGRRSDDDELARYYRENDAHLSRHESPKPRAYLTASFWRQEVEHRRADWETGTACRLFVFPRGSALGEPPAAVLGTVGLTSIVRGVLHQATLGYSLAERLQGRGVMHEALGRAIAFAFGELNLHRLAANHSPLNERSARVLQRLGFRTEGYAPAYLLVHGRWEDHVLTGLVNPDWRRPRGLLRRTESGDVVEVEPRER